MCTKDYSVSHSRDMKKNVKPKNMGDLGWLGLRKVIGNMNIGYSAYDFLLTFH